MPCFSCDELSLCSSSRHDGCYHVVLVILIIGEAITSTRLRYVRSKEVWEDNDIRVAHLFADKNI